MIVTLFSCLLWLKKSLRLATCISQAEIPLPFYVCKPVPLAEFLFCSLWPSAPWLSSLSFTPLRPGSGLEQHSGVGRWSPAHQQSAPGVCHFLWAGCTSSGIWCANHGTSSDFRNELLLQMVQGDRLRCGKTNICNQLASYGSTL